MTETNNPSSIIHHQSPASGHDLDVWGGDVTRACQIPEPHGEEDCILRIEGECPDGCRACVDFREELARLPAQAPRRLEENQGDTETRMNTDRHG